MYTERIKHHFFLSVCRHRTHEGLFICSYLTFMVHFIAFISFEIQPIWLVVYL